MTDVTADPPVPTTEQVNEAATIDPAALEHWATIQPNQRVVLNAAREDIDRLLLGLRILTFSAGDTLEALAHIDAGDGPSAKSAYARAANRNLVALTHLTQFTSAIMAKAEIDG